MDEYLKAPKDRKFCHRFAFFLCILGLNSQVWDWYDMPKNKFIRLQRLIMITLEPTTTWSQIIFCFRHYKEYSFAEFTVMLSIIPLCVNIMMKLLIAQTKIYKKGITDFMSKIHLYHTYKQNPEDEFVKTCLVTAERYTENIFYIFTVVQCISGTTWLVVPIYNSIVNNPDVNNITSRLEVVLHIWLPFDYEYNFKNWVMVNAVSTYCSYLGVTTMYVFDVLALSFTFHFIGHLKIYQHKLKTLFTEGQSQLDVYKTLSELSVEYNWIKELRNIYEGCFKYYLLTQYGQNLFQGAVLLYSITTQDLTWGVVATYGVLIPYLQGMMVSNALLLEYIRILIDRRLPTVPYIMLTLLETRHKFILVSIAYMMADEIPTLVYDLNWQDMSVRNQKMVWMLLIQVQPMFDVKAAFDLKTGVQPAINILKTTFSYNVMLKAKNDVE